MVIDVQRECNIYAEGLAEDTNIGLCRVRLEGHQNGEYEPDINLFARMRQQNARGCMAEHGFNRINSQYDDA